MEFTINESNTNRRGLLIDTRCPVCIDLMKMDGTCLQKMQTGKEVLETTTTGQYSSGAASCGVCLCCFKYILQLAHDTLCAEAEACRAALQAPLTLLNFA